MHTVQQQPQFQFTQSQYFFDESDGTVSLCVSLTDGDIIQDTTVFIESGAPIDTATGTYNN